MLGRKAVKFKTEEGQSAYKEMLDDLSGRAIRLYEDTKNLDVEPRDRFSMNLAIEQFQLDGLESAIRLGSQVDAQLIGLKGSIAIAAGRD